MRHRPRGGGKHVDARAERHAGLSFVLLIVPWVVLFIVLFWFVPEDFDRWDPGMGWLIALLFGLTWGTERLVVHLTRAGRVQSRRRQDEIAATLTRE